MSVFLSVADPSADSNVAMLARDLRVLAPEVRLRGVGGAAMQAAGVELLADTVTNAAMGVAVVGRLLEVKRLLARIGEALDRDRPRLVICTDSWSMNVHVARLAKARGIPVLYYVAPQTWASREGRVRKLREVVDKLACILPFEEAYFRKFGIDATYVGHPLWDRIRTGAAGIAYDGSRPPVIGVLPGSRRGVTKANWPRLQRVMDRIRGAFPGARFKVPLTANAREIVMASGLPADVEAKQDAIDELIPQCDLCLCVSGTAALHVAAHGVPLMVVYYGNPVLWHLLGRWVVRTRTYSLVNLLSEPSGEMVEGKHVAPEYIPWYGSVDRVADDAIRLLKNPGELAEMRRRLGEVIAPLARPGASRRVAEMAVEMLGG